MEKYLIGLDIGTSSVKGVLASCETKGKIFYAKTSFLYDTDSNGKIEIPAQRYTETCCKAIKALVSQLPENGVICGMSAASASGNVLILNKNGEAVTPIINWQDTRTKNEVTEVLGEDFDFDAYYRSTGWAFDKKTFPLATLCRLKKAKPELFKSENTVTMSTEYLLKELTGSWGISTSAGTPFYLIDQQSGKYRTDIADTLGINVSNLPPVVPVGSLIGKITPEGEALCSLPQGTPVFAGTFDHPSAARGTGVLKEGQMLLSCGTSWVGFYPLNDRNTAVENNMLIDPFLSEKGGPWAGMVSLASVASKIEFFIRKYISDSGNIYKQFEAFAKQSEPGAGGIEIDLTADSEEYIRSFPKEHIARGIMESVVKMLKTDFDRLEKGGIKAASAVMVGGPTECPLWTQVIEEITGMPVSIVNGAYAGAVGAAITAGTGAGIWQSEEAGKIFY